MTSDQIKSAIYNAFYAVIRVGVPLTQPNFFSATIVSTWPNTPAPTVWPTFWYDSVAVEIQHAFLAYGKFLPGLDGNWLSANGSKYNWNDVFEWANGTSAAIPGGIIDYSKPSAAAPMAGPQGPGGGRPINS